MSAPVLVDTSRDIPTVASLVRMGRQRLREAGIETAEREIYWMLEAVLGLAPLTARLEGGRPVDPMAAAQLVQLVTRRAAHEPLQYILGTQEFFGREFRVSPAVLIPRPETELLVREVLTGVPADHTGVIVDVGTGSGCLAVTLAVERPQASVWAIDLSRAALEVAQGNAEPYGVRARVTWLEGDLLAPLSGRGLERAVSVIVANAPYIPDAELDRLQPEVLHYEPRLALAGGPDGLALVRRVIAEATPYLAPGGLLALEVGIGQAEAVCGELALTGAFAPGVIRVDEGGIDRVVAATRVR